MIYDCPNCRTPQAAGQTICPNCHAQFDGPVPSDAIIPPEESAALGMDPVAVREAAPGALPEESAVPQASLSEPLTTDTETRSASVSEVLPAEPSPQTGPSEAAEAGATPLVEVPPAAVSSSQPLPNSQPYLTAPTYSPPPYEPPAAARVPIRPPVSRLTRGLLIAFPIALILVLGAVLYTNSLSTATDTLPSPVPASHASVPITPASAPVGPPTVLAGAGNTNNSSDDLRTKELIGRWSTSSGSYYVFNTDGTGSRGNPAKQQPEQAFLWGLVQNRLMLYMDKNEMLRFNVGPDDNTIFLSTQAGHYLQYSRSKT